MTLSIQGNRTPGRAPTGTVTTGGSVAIEIRGQKLSIRTDKDPAHVQELAKFVDSKAAQLQAIAPGVPLEKILMLVSMTVAEELFDVRDQNRTLKDQFKQRLDAALQAVADAERVD